MSKKKNHNKEYDADRETAIRKNRKNNKKSSKRSKEKDYLKDVLNGDIDPDTYADYTSIQK
tara:strand:- start:192 stop:374 length:183 start_codon:yes stop_codon:yes gene_type:complete